jgi:hypothetical protein
VNQRWRGGRDSYRVPDEVIRTSLYEVSEIPDDTTPKNFVIEHHYSGSYPAARFRFGLYERGELCGVAVFSHPCNNKVLTGVFPQLDPREAVELGRFVLLDGVPGNGETWFLARCFEQLKDRVAGVVSYSDPLPRVMEDGSVVHGGHIGTIYQAHNAFYLGRSVSRTLRILPDGTVFSPRSISKIRNLERGYGYCVDILRKFGAGEFDEGHPVGWIDTWLPVVTRKVSHPGNYKYAWGLHRSIRKSLESVGPYPKKEVV